MKGARKMVLNEETSTISDKMDYFYGPYRKDLLSSSVRFLHFLVAIIEIL